LPSGDAATADIRVTFPGSAAGDWMTVDANGLYEITRGDGAPKRWTPQN